ncbi:MAG TPA: VWA domain-containing protein, partial [Mycobacterium sp.]
MTSLRSITVRGKHIGIVARIASVAALAAVLLLAGSSAPANAVGEKNSGANRFGACLASQKTGDLLLLFDESGSLQQTDPQAARVQAARYLLQTLGCYADRVNANLDVAVAGFSDTYKPELDWTKLTAASAETTGAKLGDIANKNTGIDTDYWAALDGMRQAMAARGPSPTGGPRCQAVAWFSDGKIDFTQRSESKPYAEGTSLDSPAGVDATRQRAIDSICRPGGLADQVRSSNIITLGIGLGANQTPADFDVMSAISTGKGLNGMPCGQITDPVPGDFYPVSNIDDMLFAFDALNPDPGINDQGPVCQLQVCPEARHNFVLDRSIKAVNILGSGGVPGVVPYLVAPSGETLELPKKDGKNSGTVAGVPVSYEWQSESAQTIGIQNTGGPGWAGQWAIVYVDTTGQHPDAVSKVSIHITTDIFPVLTGADKLAWHSGAPLKGLVFGLIDGQNKPVQPADLAGTASLSASLVPAGAAPIPLLQGVGKDDIAKPVDADLTKVNPGSATLKMSLVITTAPAMDPAGVQIAPGTQLSPQDVEVPIQILPKL